MDNTVTEVQQLADSKKLNLSWIIELYEKSPEKVKFFDNSFSDQIGRFENLSGVDDLCRQIERGASKKEIRASWAAGLAAYKKMRAKYVIYKN